MVNTTFTSGTWNNIFNDPFFIGFGPNIRTWHHVSGQNNYPPYNLIQEDDDTYLVEIALAGFDKDDISVTTDKDQLIIKGEREEEKDTTYTHKGIATRSFTRSFALAEFMVVTGAEFENGMLSIRVERIVPEEKKPKSIKIK